MAQITYAQPFYYAPFQGFARSATSKPKSQKIATIYEKLDDYKVTKKGQVIHNVVLTKDEEGNTAARKF